MKLPFTVEQFLEVFRLYNEAIWPAQVVAYVAGLAVLVLIAIRSRHAGLAASAVLGAMWLVNGAGYHLGYFSDINAAARFFGGLFVVQAALIAWQGLARNSMVFAIRANAATAVGAMAIVYAMIGYPLLGLAFGHVYPSAPVFGVAPCPTTIFTLGILLLARPSVPVWLFVIPLVWSAIGGSAAVLLNVREDFGLIATGVAAILVLALSHYHKRTYEAHA